MTALRAVSPFRGRESEVASLGDTLDRMTSGCLAQQLYVSRRTVQTHLSHVFSKLAVSSRAQLAAEANRHQPSLASKTTGPKPSARIRP
jgi:DNA-binding CsgD family transcriptional regulator